MNYLIGIGNYTCGDDGIGPRLIEAVCDRGLDDGFEALELPGHGIDLLTRFVPETGSILIVDCARMGLAASSHRLFSPDEATSHKKTSGLSTHENDILELIDYGRAAGCPIPRIRILAIEPDNTQLGTTLSPALEAKFEAYLTMACAEMQRLQEEKTPWELT
jgi:hydrogenase maturation protease